MASWAEIEPKALVQGFGKLVRGERLVTLEELSIEAFYPADAETTANLLRTIIE